MNLDCDLRSLCSRTLFAMQPLAVPRLLCALLGAVWVSTAGSVVASAVLMPSPAQAADAAKLGDMTPFRSIASDVLSLVQKGALQAATQRVKNLEIAWDRAESGLKPRAAVQWHAVDKAIDRVLSELRRTPPDALASSQALKDLLVVMDAAR